MKKMKNVALVGYGVIGKRVADAINVQDDMDLIGVCDVINDWRIQNAVRKEYDIYAATTDAEKQMKASGISVKGNLQDLLDKVDLLVDCTPKNIAAKNVEVYKNKVLSSLFKVAKSTRPQDIPLVRKTITNPL